MESGSVVAWAKMIGLSLVLVFLAWPIQYLVVLPLRVIGRLLILMARLAGNIFMLIMWIVLLLIPVVGWLALFFLMWKRISERRHQETLAALGYDTEERAKERTSMLKPWGVDSLKDSWANATA